MPYLCFLHYEWKKNKRCRCIIFNTLELCTTNLRCVLDLGWPRPWWSCRGASALGSPWRRKSLTWAAWTTPAAPCPVHHHHVAAVGRHCLLWIGLDSIDVARTACLEIWLPLTALKEVNAQIFLLNESSLPVNRFETINLSISQHTHTTLFQLYYTNTQANGKKWIEPPC